MESFMQRRICSPILLVILLCNLVLLPAPAAAAPAEQHTWSAPPRTAAASTQRQAPASLPHPTLHVTPKSTPARATIPTVPAARPRVPQPLAFEPNLGQTDRSVQFQTLGRGGNVFFTPDALVLALPSEVVSDTATVTSGSAAGAQQASGSPADSRRREPTPHVVTGVSLHYEHANRTPQIVAMDQLPGLVNYLIGTDQSAWQTGVPTYEGIRYVQLYPGIDLQVDGSEGQLKSTYLVAPGADPSQIQWSYRGGRDVTVTAQGTLEVEVPVSPPAGWRATQPLTITEQAPVA
jgi:hypothetical protein